MEPPPGSDIIQQNPDIVDNVYDFRMFM